MRKKLVKLGLVAGIATTSLFGFTYEIKQGWQQLGAIKDFDDLKSFDDTSCVEYLWYYDLDEPVDKEKWKLHISDGKNYNYCGKTFSSLKKGDGFWLKASGECNITVTEPNNCNSSGFPTPPSLDGSTCDANVTIPDNNSSSDGANNPSEVSAIPALTSNTDENITVSASSTLNAYHAWYAFDNKFSGNNEIWETYGFTSPEWLKIDFNDNLIINKYRIRPYNLDQSGAPKDWILQASNDNINWDNLDTRVNETTWTTETFNTYTFVNSKSYRYYRLYVSDENGRGYLDIDEFELIKAQ